MRIMILPKLSVLTLLGSLLGSLIGSLYACGRHEAAIAPVAPQKPNVPLHGDDAKPADDQPSNEEVANFRGFVAISDLLNERLVSQTVSFDFDKYLEDSGGFGGGLGDLAQLLGFSSGDGQHSDFRNGKANAMNVVLWHMALSGVARDLAAHCDHTLADNTLERNGMTAAPNQALMSVMQPLCAWPDASARNATQLRGLWNVAMENDAPETEYQAFQDFFLSDSYADAPPSDAISAMLTAIFFNPHFLLQK